MRKAAPVIALLLAANACLGAAPAPGAIADAAQARDARTVQQLISRGLDVNAPGRDGTPALVWSVRLQDTDLARRLLKAGANPNQASRLGVLPMHIAIANGDIEAVRLLLGAGAEPECRDTTGETCLMMAARTGREDVVRALLDSGVVVDGSDEGYQQTPLMIACREGHSPIVALLLDKGAKVNARTRIGKVPEFRTPASNSGSKGAGIVRGGWPERGERDPVPGAKTPLLYASREGHLQIVTQLLDAGAEIEASDADGVTPLLLAVLNGHVDVVRELIARGASVRASDWYGQTPLFAAVDYRNLDVSGPTRDNGVDRAALLGLIGLLIEHGADVNARTREYPPQRRWITRLGSLSWVDFTGQTPFLRAALAGDVAVMRLLIDHGADANIPTFNGTTPLMAAAGVNWVHAQTYDEGPQALLEAVKLALEKGNDVNAVNSMGLQAIHGAANRGSDEIIKFLAAKGATLNRADKEGRTPQVWAQGVFLATHPPEAKPKSIELIRQLQGSTL